MITIDVFRSGQEAMVLVTGSTAPPSVVCLDNGESARLSPARVEGQGVSYPVVIADHANAWIGDLPVPAGESARLWIEADGEHHRCAACWSPPTTREQPAPQLKPKAKRRM